MGPSGVWVQRSGSACHQVKAQVAFYGIGHTFCYRRGICYLYLIYFNFFSLSLAKEIIVGIFNDWNKPRDRWSICEELNSLPRVCSPYWKLGGIIDIRFFFREIRWLQGSALWGDLTVSFTKTIQESCLSKFLGYFTYYFLFCNDSEDIPNLNQELPCLSFCTSSPYYWNSHFFMELKIEKLVRLQFYCRFSLKFSFLIFRLQSVADGSFRKSTYNYSSCYLVRSP